MYCQVDQPPNQSGMTLYNDDWAMPEDNHVCGDSSCTLEALKISLFMADNPMYPGC